MEAVGILLTCSGRLLYDGVEAVGVCEEGNFVTLEKHDCGEFFGQVALDGVDQGQG